MRMPALLLLLLAGCARTAPVEREPGFFGVSIGDYEEEIIVEWVYEGTAAAAVDIRAGDKIRKVNGFEVRTVTEVVEKIGGLLVGDSITVLLDREGESIEVTGQLGPKLEDPPILR